MELPNTNMIDVPVVMTLAQAARHLRVAAPTLRRWTDAGRVPLMARDAEGRPVYARAELDRWLGENGGRAPRLRPGRKPRAVTS